MNATQWPCLAALCLAAMACGGGDGEGGSFGGNGGAPAAGSAGASGSSGAPGAGSGGSTSAGGSGGSAPMSGEGGTTTAGAGGASGGASGGTTAGKVPMFVAQGSMGRLTVSCDDGKTWIANDSDDDSVRCGGGTDCDHGPTAPIGLAYGAGHFLAMFGWGGDAPGVVRKSADGVTWTNALEGSDYAGLAFGSGRFVLGDDYVVRISADASSFREVELPTLSQPTVRQTFFAPTRGGRFVVTADNGGSRAVMVVSADGGETWQSPNTYPEECGSWNRGVTGNADVMVIASLDGYVCRSTDGGMTWSVADVDRDVALTSPPLWDGQRFVIWARGTAYVSPDATTWTARPNNPNTAVIGAVARSPAGTFVATRETVTGNAGYAAQQMYRSRDGENWEVLPAAAFVASHPIIRFTYGEAAPSSACPAP